MIIRKIKPEEKDQYNKVVNHPLQSWQWGEFKRKTGMDVIRLGHFEEGELVSAYQILTRNIPKTSYRVGQLLKSQLPDEETISALKDVCEKEDIVYILIEPEHIVRRWENKKGTIKKPPEVDKELDLTQIGLQEAEKKLFATYSFVLDLNPSEKELMADMHRKTRYNVRLAEKKGVQVYQQNDQKGLDILIDLLNKTMKRQGFYMHDENYFRQLWQVLEPANMVHILLAEYENEILAAWMLLTYKNRIFYPYGASSSKHRDVMASNLICWEAIKLGKKLGCIQFDMWGSLGPKPDKSDDWYGFHRFKRGYGGDLVEFVGSWDLVYNPFLYQGVQIANKLRWKYLNLKSKLPF
jgi:lipid II:glycine glycyltransferase (peptidoglycan interpeptide bridge formation enzyme)